MPRGVRLVGHPYGLISALEKLGAYNKRIPMDNVTPATSSLYIVMPLSVGGAAMNLFSTHPPLDKRIYAALQESRHYPIANAQPFPQPQDEGSTVPRRHVSLSINFAGQNCVSAGKNFPSRNDIPASP